MMIPHDYHVHSRFSGDNEASIEAMCQAAIKRGIPEICFTEHFDVNPKEPLRYQFHLDDWARELDRCRELFDGQLVILAGLELSEPHVDPEPVEKLVESYPFDLLIGSVHWVGDEVIFNPAYFKRSPEEAYQRYFDELEQMTRFGGFDVLGHLDIVARKGFEAYGEYDPCHHEAMIRPVLANCIANLIALEINAGCMRRPIKRLMPDIEILNWYVEMGGERLVFSSDAHEPEQMGMNIERAVTAAEKVGIKRTLRFRERKSEWITWD